MCKRTRSSDASATTDITVARGATAGRRDDATTRAPVTAVEALRDIYSPSRDNDHALVSQSPRTNHTSTRITKHRFHALARPHRPRARCVRPHRGHRRQETLGHHPSSHRGVVIAPPTDARWTHGRARARDGEKIFFGRVVEVENRVPRGQRATSSSNPSDRQWRHGAKRRGATTTSRGVFFSGHMEYIWCL